MTFSKRYTIAVLGGGLAGTSVAWALKQAGHNPVIIAPNGIADGASGNPRGLYNPRPAKQWSGIAQTHAVAWARFHHFLSTQDPDKTGWHANGALHLFRDPDQTARLMALIDVWGWSSDMAQVVDATQASDIAGIDITQNALWLPRGGTVAPGKICALYATDIPVRPDMPEHYDGIVIATGAGALTHPDLAHLPLKTVRGQISYMRANDLSSRIKTNLCYGGYLTPADHGVHVLGATFQHWLSGTTLRDEDHIYVRDKLHASVGPIFTPDEVIGGRASLRVTSKDHAPLIGQVHTTTDIPTYVSVAHGSHGLITAHLGAHMIADAISHAPSSVSTTIAATLSPDRFKID